jgi:hypothetical protein
MQKKICLPGFFYIKFIIFARMNKSPHIIQITSMPAMAMGMMGMYIMRMHR